MDKIEKSEAIVDERVKQLRLGCLVRAATSWFR